MTQVLFNFVKKFSYMSIISKFTVGSEEGIDLLFDLKRLQFKQICDGVIEPEEIDQLIDKKLDRRDAINELNDLSSQMVIVFENDKPLGYAIVKSSYEQPEILEDKKAVYLTFYIAAEYISQEVYDSLWQKCLSITRSYAHWIELSQNDPLIPFFERSQFKICGQSHLKQFDIPSHIMVRNQQ